MISGLTKMLQRVNEMVPTVGGQRSFSTEQDRYCYESIVIVLDTLERCLVNQPKDTTKFEEAMNVKFLLWEICQFIGTVSFSRSKKYFILFYFLFCFGYFTLFVFADLPNDSPQNTHLKNLASKVLFALSFNSSRLCSIGYQHAFRNCPRRARRILITAISNSFNISMLMCID